MIKNYITIALRNLFRQPGYTVINVLGLAVGLACFMIIMMYVMDEMSYDKWHKNGDNIYRVALERQYPGRSRDYAIIPHSYSEAIKTENPEVVESCRLLFFPGNPILIKQDNQIFEESNYLWADSSFFNMFDINVLKGDKNTALMEPNGVVITESLANKYFGNTDPIGKTLDIPQNDNDLLVKAVCEDIPENTHFDFDLLMSSKSLNFLQNPNFLGFSAYTYLMLSENANPASLEAKFPDLVTKYASGQVLNNFGVDYAEYQKQGNGYKYFLQPLKDIYLTSNLEGELKTPGSKQRVYFFMVIALLILGIACINFMNLATARSASRAKEVGIRKTLGSERILIIIQFFIEAILITFLGAVIAFVLHYLSLDYFNEITNKSFAVQDLLSPKYLGLLALITGGTGLLSGAYPALVLSSFKPIEVLRGHFSKTKKGSGLRNALVVFQFGISVFLIISTIVVYQQMIYAQNKQLGFDKDHLVTLQGAGGMTPQQEETLKNEIRTLSGVVAVSGCNTQPGEQYFGVSFKPPQDNEMTTGSGLIVDYGYLECMKMNLIEGRDFDKRFADTLSVIVNESAVKEMGIDNPIGTRLESPENFLNNQDEERAIYTIIGVIQDFHFQSLHNTVSPLFLVHNTRGFAPGVDNLITVRMQPNAAQATLASIENLWSKFQPDLPFRYAFLDRAWANLYTSEMTSRKVFSVFSLLAIFIACLGLLALAAFTAEQRVKEIGIRKILGATSSNIVGLLSKDFLKLVLVSIVIASPLAWYAMNTWLQDFAYRIGVQWWVFLLAGIIAVIIAFLTVSFQSIRAARANPVNSLRSE